MSSSRCLFWSSCLASACFLLCARLPAIGEITRFPSAKKLVGYAGLGASVHDSGDTHRGGHITKEGRRDLRYVMVEAAWVAVEHHPHWKTQFEHLTRAHGQRDQRLSPSLANCWSRSGTC